MSHILNTGYQQVKLFSGLKLIASIGHFVHMCWKKFGVGFMRLLRGWIFLSTSYPHCGQGSVLMFLPGVADWFWGLFIFGFKNPIVYITGPVFW